MENDYADWTSPCPEIELLGYTITDTPDFTSAPEYDTNSAKDNAGTLYLSEKDVGAAATAPELALDASWYFPQGNNLVTDFLPEYSSTTPFAEDPNPNYPNLSLPAVPDPSHLWNSTAQTPNPQLPAESFLQVCIQLSASQIQSLMTKVHVLEASLKDSERKIEEFATWARKMDKHYHETSNTVLDLFKMVQKPEFLRSVLKEPVDGTLIQQSNAKKAAKFTEDV